ncbi:TIGR02186 family protein [Pontibaca salina]|uniref:TIGR02186 family protein n=1 Tax=Pontibaca salina TaxID=2795731 RepID=A0A934LXJ4_9RHOB|nr:TIGR02186 family protein [Pontibaca salina]MBI6628692.1 TIGR02186 family protein [Pontibaca salina]
MLLPSFAHSEEVVMGLSDTQVSINTSFTGSQILIFGAVKREAPIRADAPLHVVITVEGPKQRVTVRRKSRWFGVWVNTAAVEVDAAPSFYAVATTAPLNEILTSTEDLRRKISINRAIRSVGAPDTIKDSSGFTDAIVRIRQKENLYQEMEGDVKLDQQTLFRTAISMPSDLIEGEYSVRVFLTRNREIVSDYKKTIDVRKVGLERWLFALSREQPIIYGLMALVIAIAAGWGASAAFRKLRNW